MAKVIEISNDIVSIGCDNGQLKEVRISDFNFNPEINDEVELYESENKIIINKKEKGEIIDSKNDGINININNQNSNPTPYYVAYGSKAVNKVSYCVLALCLGGLGIHKFYAGKTGTGILYFIFCWTWIPLILSLFDFIIALCKNADSNGIILI